ncbi:MAG: MlaD family protein [Thermoanaerobaculia bacterium]|nr:MlaD family protein [Thermoanaerobaculia bacterium]
MPRDTSPVRVGALVLAALLVLVAGVFLIGEQNNLFRPMNHYWVAFDSASGLQGGNPVQLNGVDVGRVEEIVLPEDPSIHQLRVKIAVDSRYAQRIRKDSRARIKTLGLLGDKYVELTSGSEEVPAVADGGDVPAAQATNVDRLISSGEDAVENIVAISVSLARILERMERGEGVLGQLLAPLPDEMREKPLVISLHEAMAGIDRVVRSIEQGRGPVGRLLNDEQLGDRVASSVERLEALLTRVESADGLAMALLEDQELKGSFERSLANLEQTSERLSRVVAEIEEGEGLLPRLMNDEEYADQVLNRLRDLVGQLDVAVTQMTEGEGTVAKLIADPSVYEAINDIIIGVNESRILRWLIRNRQKKGIETRYEEALENQGSQIPNDEHPASEPGID